jgi:hypothetical protein
MTNNVNIVIKMKYVLSVLIMISLASACTPDANSPIQLPTGGRIYTVVEHNGVKSLQPVQNALVLVDRVEGCPGNEWLLMHSSTNQIDIHLVRTDTTGTYRLPAGEHILSCDGSVFLIVTAFVPGYASLPGIRFLDLAKHGQPLYRPIKWEDVILERRDPNAERAQELAFDIYAVTTNFDVTEPLKHPIYEEMRPEVDKLSSTEPDVWNKECARWDACKKAYPALGY